ncbi:MAG: c-type cytochrome [Verrucomicrobiaceae bacterium]|nr:c-type cytochrome [Verrucomicrobiaceae bacterium]
MKGLFNWIDDRTGIAKLTREALFESVPGGARWRYVWGSTLSFAIMVQFITGVFLWMGYSPSATSAWESVYYIQNEMSFGWLLRGIHHWTAQIMVILLVLHLVQVVIDSAYRAPREFNFWFGVLLLFITLAISLTGYLLPWDQKGFWATKVATNLAGVVPLIGGDLQKVIIGGSDYGHHTLTRFFALHAGVLPGALVALIVVHIYLFRRHGITEAKPATRAGALYYWCMLAVVFAALAVMAFIFQDDAKRWVPWIVVGVFSAIMVRIVFLILRGKDDDSARRPRRDGMFWPDQILKDAIACVAVMAAVLFFVFWKGTELTAPADPSQPYNAARPDWYFMSLFQMLKFSVFEGALGLVIGAIFVPSILVTAVFMMPLIGTSKIGHWVNVVMLYVLIGGFAVLTAMGFNHDANDEEYKLSVANAHADAERLNELISINGGIPPEGALTLLYKDAKIRGPKLFAANCASCHPHGGLDGIGGEVKEPSAPDLKGVGSQQWIAGLLELDRYISAEYFGNTGFKDGKMAGHLEDIEMLPDDIEAVSAALASEAKVHGYVLPQGGKEFLDRGFDLMFEDLECADCHGIQGEDEGKGPSLTGYMSRDWMIRFVGDPSHADFYGKKNDRMPSFLGVKQEDGTVKSGQLSRQDVELIVDWLRGEWARPGKSKG